ncbi:MAG: SoxR reducing system RseC family protein [Bacteroidetes bacterium]|jgi:sigma-E factor negative regulatory protein RseC|nr:SoxR reducing system RseC family protein [Bacteroidota bacterium]MBT6687691.1 SoxR reducing system RseC family protein [Bacteroidota bacterium]MBT7143614.1 SoxR reducing system RseC family protein [Bacteroidota bacterium]MBT7490515.1 SoxR reducing system RseC family protein [Bacteroidota bacterium]
MSSTKTIEHKGFIKSIDAKQIRVSILAESSCASCHAKGLCNLSEVDEKEIEIVRKNGDFSIGETVNVIMQESLGFHAMFLGYIFPFILVLATLIVSSNFSNNEAISGLLSLSVLIPYYIILYFSKSSLKKKFSFTLQKIV